MMQESPAKLTVTLFTDPACPWGYSALPALRVLEWRYGSQLDWRLMMIGLTEDAEQYVERGYTTQMAAGHVMFRDRWRMPFVTRPKARMAATSVGCRLVVAGSIDHPGSEWLLTRELQFANFVDDTVLLDDISTIVPALEASPRVTDIDVAALAARIDDEDVRSEYERQRTETRSAAGRAGALQGKTANTDGAERYTAPSIVFSRPDGRTFEATGFQPVESYDVLIANLDPTLERRAPAETIEDALAAFPGGLTSAEVAAIRTKGNDAIDVDAAETELIRLAASGTVRRESLGDDAVWYLA